MSSLERYKQSPLSDLVATGVMGYKWSEAARHYPPNTWMYQPERGDKDKPGYWHDPPAFLSDANAGQRIIDRMLGHHNMRRFCLEVIPLGWVANFSRTITFDMEDSMTGATPQEAIARAALHALGHTDVPRVPDTITQRDGKDM